MTTATVNISHTPSQQPFLKELMAKHENPPKIELPSTSKMDNEETPQKRDVELVLTRGDTASSSLTFNESLTLKDQVSPPNLLLRREESDATSELSYDSSEGDSINSIFSSGKLYGRTEEEAILEEALDRITQRKAPRKLEYVLISGGCGTGKTRLSETLRQRVNSKGGYFCSGKFDQQQADPFAPLCAAFTDYFKQVMREPEDVAREVRQRIRSALEGDMCAMIKMIPSLADLMDDGMSTEEEFQCARRCNDKQGRSIFAMHKLMRAICSPERPVVFMIDDLQWASSCPLKKLRCMVLDDMNDGILLLGICRDNVSPDSALSSFLRELEDQQVDITNIILDNLELKNIVEMTNELFLMPQEQTESLAKFVFDHSNGNAYVAIECIRLLQQESRMLQYDEKSNIWSVNDDICDEMMTYCPATFTEGKLRTLPRNIQKVFMVCSCLGSNITEHLVQIALQEPVEERFKQIVKKGKLVYNESRKTYSFRHNSFQTACYDLITEELQPALHLEIGMRLWKHLDEKEVDKKLFVILNQLKRGATLMSDQSMRYEVAALCIRAAEKAAVLFSFPTASDQLKFACSLLGLNHWEEAYDLSLILYNYAAEVEFSLADSDRVDYLLKEVLEHARDFSDKIRAYSTQVYMYGVRGKADRAIETGICVLKTLGVHLKPQCHKLSLALSMSRIDRKLKGKSDESIKRLPHMTDPNKLAAMQILNMLFLNTYIARRDLYPFVVLKMMKLTLTDGLSAISSVAFAGYGTLLCFAGQIEEGMRYGKIALDLVDEFDAQSFQSRVGALVWGTIIVHRRPWKESLEQLQEGHRLGLQTGDTEFAMMNANLYVHFMIDSGMFRLSETIAHAKELKALTELHGHSKQVRKLLTKTV
jgi:predicted ATPase